VQSFLKDIEDTYFAFDKEKDLLTRAYKMAENEYVEINNHLNEEIKNRKETISFLKSSISKFSSKNENIVSENLIDFSTLIVEEIEKRQKAEETLKVLINNLNMGIILKDASGKIIYVNTSVYDIFKIENDSENDYSSLLEKIGILRSRSLKSSQLKRQYRNNIYGSQYVTEIWSYEESRLIEEVMIPYLYGNNERGFIFTFSDVTERERSNELIRISELRYNQILKGFPDAVILINANGKIKFSNKRTTEIFGWNSNEIIDQDIRLLIPFEGFLTVKNTIDNAIQIDDLLNNIAELKITDRFGKELWIEYSFVRMEEIHETSYCCFVRDSTNRKLAENEIKKQKKFTEDILIKTLNYYDSPKCLDHQLNLSPYFCFYYSFC
jgi:PAS domain S-box-containing protein